MNTLLAVFVIGCYLSLGVMMSLVALVVNLYKAHRKVQKDPHLSLSAWDMATSNPAPYLLNMFLWAIFLPFYILCGVAELVEWISQEYVKGFVDRKLNELFPKETKKEAKP